jgi:hypothetical protein
MSYDFFTCVWYKTVLDETARPTPIDLIDGQTEHGTKNDDLSENGENKPNESTEHALMAVAIFPFLNLKQLSS